MTFPIKRDSNSITIATFWESYELGKYNFDPPYQRRSVWTDEKQSFLIDSVLRNFPIPPIFLHQHIDQASGRTTYDVIDGKQRLISLERFIRNEIPIASDLDGEDENESAMLSGKRFKDFDAPELAAYKKAFWRYVIPVEYVDTDDAKTISGIFDRLNRNGEPLEGQELRNAKFAGTAFHMFVTECASHEFWKDYSKRMDVKRMEDIEFLAELLFLILERQPTDGGRNSLDEMFSKYSVSPDIAQLKSEFETHTEELSKLIAGIESVSRLGVSHVYGLWSFLVLAKDAKQIADWRDRLAGFYLFFSTGLDENNALIQQYRMTVTYRTRTRGQRKKRLEALSEYVLSGG
jgi:hypothetical protein